MVIGREYWQAVRSAGKIESNAVFQKSPHTYGVRKNRTAVRIPTKPFSPKGWFAYGTVSRVIGFYAAKIHII